MRFACLSAALFALLAACAREPAAPLPAVALPTTATPTTATRPAPIAAGQHRLSGSLLTPPPGSEVELALLLVDPRDRPQQLLGSQNLSGNGQPLAFEFGFLPTSAPPGSRIELRVRVSQAGRLILRLPPRALDGRQDHRLGTLQLVAAP